MQYTAQYNFSRSILSSLLQRRTLTNDQRAAVAAVLSGKASPQTCATVANTCQMYGAQFSAKAVR